MATLCGKPLISWITDTASPIFDRMLVVTRSSDVKALCDERGVEAILHAEPDRSDTVRIGITQLATQVDYCIFIPGDQPLITRETLLKFKEEAEKDHKLILRAGFGERSGAPVGFPEWTFSELMNLPEGKGGNAIVKRYPDRVKTVSAGEEWELDDIDTPDDLRKIEEIISKKLFRG